MSRSGKVRYGLKVPFAEGGDFEDKIREDLKIETRIEFGRQYLEGMNELQTAGFIYGDIKPENCLIFGKGHNQTLKITDFGKTRKIKTDDNGKEIPQRYKGNIRFVPPEGKLSKKGEVWGAALVMIRNFEEMILPEDKNTSLWGEVEEAQKDEFLKNRKKIKEDGKYKNKRMQKRRGIERFIIEHEAFQATAGSGWTNLLRRAKLMNLSQDEKLFQKQVLDRYIDLLAKEFKEKNIVENSKVDQFAALLKNMTQIDPNKRLAMEDALEEYNEIFSEKNKSIPSA